MTAEGILNQLGRPEVDRLTVLVREAAQNSWDARDRDHDGPVRFQVDVRRLSAEFGRTWTRHFGETEFMRGVPINEELNGPAAAVMFVSDRGTTGLGGPTRADEAIKHGEHDYVSFVLNVGDPRDTEFGGGTYGYGKSVLYATSRTRAVVVHSRCREKGSIQSRLVGIALGGRHTTERVNYTGRHWWGLPFDDDRIEPIIDEEADEIAAELGFPIFEDAECGTSIALLAPELDERSPEEAADWIAETVLWHLWPKMLPGPEGYPDMTFGVTVDGSPVVVQKPGDHRALRLFSRALMTLDADEGAGELLQCGNPKQNLGRLEVVKTYEPSPPLGPVAEEAGLRASVHHICLLRAPRLVVEYRSGPPPMDENVWYAGVYLADEKLDEVLARSEPPTHHAWVSSQLEGRDKTFVNTTLRRIDERLRVFGAPVTPPAEGPVVPLGTASRFLAGLLGDVTGQGADVSRGGKGGPGPRRPVRLLGDPRWDLYDGTPVLAQRVQVDTSRTVTMQPVLAVGVWGGGAETDAPTGSAQPSFVAWRASEGGVQTEAVIAFSPADNGEWDLLVQPVSDSVTSIGLRSAGDEEDL
ncbi:MAG: hypothetical protein LC750_07470 [Actinobacteria bacterium]|nr:hypothetical protein [Actinomycetota bacterium]